MPENIPQIRAYNKFLEFRNHYLLLMKRKYGLRDEDSEDLFEEAIIIGIRKFDSDRGEFESFFFTVYENKIRNFIARENLSKILLSLDEYDHVDDLKDDTENDDNYLEYFNSIEHFSNSLKKLLSEEENLFFEELRNVVIDNSSGFISITSRNLGMEPSKGWDVWRKIQRKIKSLLEQKKKEESDSFTISKLELPEMIERGAVSRYDIMPYEPRPVERLQYLEHLSESEVNLLLSYFG